MSMRIFSVKLRRRHGCLEPTVYVDRTRQNRGFAGMIFIDRWRKPHFGPEPLRSESQYLFLSALSENNEKDVEALNVRQIH